MKIALRFCILLLVAFAGSPTEVMAACADSETHQCGTDINQDDYHDAPCDAPCDDSSCDCICCGTASLLFSYDLWKPATLKSTAIKQPQAYISLFDHLFTSSIWQPPKSI